MRKKRCPKCDQPKHVNQFGWKNQAKGLRDVYCRTCRRTYNRSHYDRNKSAYRARNRRANERQREWLRTLKVGPCVDCRKKYPPCVMDFDHRDPTGKIANVSVMIQRWNSKKKVLAEIAKCDLVCANCHRLRTCKRSHNHARKA